MKPENTRLNMNTPILPLLAYLYNLIYHIMLGSIHRHSDQALSWPYSDYEVLQCIQVSECMPPCARLWRMRFSLMLDTYCAVAGTSTLRCHARVSRLALIQGGGFGALKNFILFYDFDVIITGRNRQRYWSSKWHGNRSGKVSCGKCSTVAQHDVECKSGITV